MLYENQRDMQPYAYDMQDYLPQPMGGVSNASLPALSPSMVTPQLNAQSFMPDGFQGGKPQYRKGGLARFQYKTGGSKRQPSLADISEFMRQQGEFDDKVLAHINPEEAQQLEMQSGAPSINPHTNLPQYGFKKLVKKVARFALPIAGGIVAGPAGAAIGGGLGGIIAGGKHKYRNAILGAGLGYAGSGGFGNLGGVGNIIPGIGNATGLSGVLPQFAGMQGLGVMGGAGGAGGAAAGAGGAAAGAGGAGSGLGLNNLLMGGALLGTLGSKRKVPDEPSLADAVRGADVGNKGLEHRPVKPMERIQKIWAEDEDQNGAAEKVYFEDVNPITQYKAEGGPFEEFEEEEIVEGFPTNRYQRGLGKFVDGGTYVEGGTGGQDDKINARLSDGEYVIPADIVSSLGDGNNRAGAKKFDAMLANVRRHKTSKGAKGLPPKAKKINSYLSRAKR